MCSWVGGFGFGLDIGLHNFKFRIRIGYGVCEKISDPIRLQNFNIRTREMARAANIPVFGPSAKVLKQSANTFFSGVVIPGRCGLLASKAKFLFFAVSKSNNETVCCCTFSFTVLLIFRFTCFHANQWTMSRINQSNQHQGSQFWGICP